MKRNISILFLVSVLLLTGIFANKKAEASEHLECPSLSRNLTIGSTGADVVELQQFLIDNGNFENVVGRFPVASSTPIEATGYFGPITQAAVADFQTANKIRPNEGFVGPVTISAILSQCRQEESVISVNFVDSDVRVVRNDNGNDTGVFEVEFDVTAENSDVLIPYSASSTHFDDRVARSTKINYLLERNGRVVERDLTEILSVDSGSGVVLTNSDIAISEGSTARITLTVSHTSLNEGDEGIYQLFLSSIPWDEIEREAFHGYRTYKYLYGFEQDQSIIDIRTSSEFLNGSGGSSIITPDIEIIGISDKNLYLNSSTTVSFTANNWLDRNVRFYLVRFNNSGDYVDRVWLGSASPDSSTFSFVVTQSIVDELGFAKGYAIRACDFYCIPERFERGIGDTIENLILRPGNKPLKTINKKVSFLGDGQTATTFEAVMQVVEILKKIGLR